MIKNSRKKQLQHFKTKHIISENKIQTTFHFQQPIIYFFKLTRLNALYDSWQINIQTLRR